MTIARLEHIIDRIATGRADFKAVSFVEHIALLRRIELLDERLEQLEFNVTHSHQRRLRALEAFAASSCGGNPSEGHGEQTDGPTKRTAPITATPPTTSDAAHRMSRREYAVHDATGQSRGLAPREPVV